MEKIIIIAGATASGKTSASVEVAKLVDGEIICADSMQIYKHMDIGTAKVTESEMDNIPHHLIDIINPDVTYNVSDYINMAKPIITDIVKRGKIPIIVGGTGLYVDSLIYPYTLGGNDFDSKIRSTLERELIDRGSKSLHDELTLIDPIDASKIHPNNTRRLIRALEIFRTTGKSKTDRVNAKSLQYVVDMNIITSDREVLYDKINLRVDKMYNEGLLNEVKTLLALGYNFDMQSMQAIGYKEFAEYFNGDLTLQQVAIKIKQNSRNYAKRQITWFKRYDFADFLSQNDCILKYRR